MSRTSLYRLLIRLMPQKGIHLRAVDQTMPDAKKKAYEGILRRHKAAGGALAFFNQETITDFFTFGEARPGTPVVEDIAFRLASVSKLVSAAGILAMREQGLIDLDRDADTGLPYSLRHPQAPDVPITLRMLLTHTAGIFDGERYLKGIERGEPAGGLLAGDSHTKHLPSEGCEYSNFGVGLAGCVAEAQTGLSFECAMQRYLFEPLGMKASYYPQLLDSLVANARRIFPPQKHINFDAAARQARPKTGWDTPDAQAHHLFAHGSCCMDVKSLVTLGQALMTPGFFTQDTLQEMRSPLGSLHGRDPSLTQGLGMFILEDEQLSPNPLYGHQGMAYGAVHMLFLDLARGRGIISLTTGVSEAREYIMADVNRALLKEWAQDD
ncbi:MAG TPA: beta-lactamase family protein [Clostridiales bacterium]|nr:beta-lactamase family protein [Clostridiales bacterium]